MGDWGRRAAGRRSRCIGRASGPLASRRSPATRRSRTDRLEAHRGMDVRRIVGGARSAEGNGHEPFVWSAAAVVESAFGRVIVTTSSDCERVRIAVMATLDGEGEVPSESDRQHLSTCASCQRWQHDLQSMSGALRHLSYPHAQLDWATVKGRINPPELRPAVSARLWPVLVIVLGWRALELFIDLPIPLLHPLVPLAATVAALWLIAGNPLAIETSDPELQKRGA